MKSLSRREALSAGAAALASSALLALPAAAETADPLPGLVERYLSLYPEYERLSLDRELAFEREGEKHPSIPEHHIGLGASVIIDKGDISGIEKHFGPAIASAKTEADRRFFEHNRDMHIRWAAKDWEKWDRRHRELGLYDLEARIDAIDAQLYDLEARIAANPPRTLAGAVALLRYAQARAEQGIAEPDDLVAALAFLEPLSRRSAA